MILSGRSFNTLWGWTELLHNTVKKCLYIKHATPYNEKYEKYKYDITFTSLWYSLGGTATKRSITQRKRHLA
jgi:hypothetical protein